MGIMDIIKGKDVWSANRYKGKNESGDASYERITGAKKPADTAYEKATGAKPYTKPKKSKSEASGLSGVQKRAAELGSRINKNDYNMNLPSNMGMGFGASSSRRSKPKTKKKLQQAFYDPKTGKTYVAKSGGKKKSSHKRNNSDPFDMGLF